MEFLRRCLELIPEYGELKRLPRTRYPVMVTGLSRIHKANIIDALSADTRKKSLIIVADEGEAARLAEDLALLSRKTVIFPYRDLCFRNISSVSREFERERIGALSAILGGADVVIASASAASFTPPVQTLRDTVMNIKTGDEIPMQDIIKRLVTGGYSRAAMVEGVGQFAVRGGIIDIFVPSLENPVRIEFFGDETDTIAEFDLVTQRRLGQLQSVDICPARELIFEPELLSKKLAEFAKTVSGKARENILSDAKMLADGVVPSGCDKYMPLCYEPASLLDYFDDGMVFIYEPSRVFERLKNFGKETAALVKQLFEEGLLCKGLDKYTCSAPELAARLQREQTVLLETFTARNNLIEPAALIHFNLLGISAYNGATSGLAQELSSYLNRGYTVVVTAGSKRAATATAQELREFDIAAAYHETVRLDKPRTVIVTDGGLPAGIDYIAAKIAVITRGRAQTKVKKRHYTHSGAAVGTLEELRRGDAVVHSVYGIGIFDGINKINTQGVIKDYIKIKFQNNDVLYVPVIQLDLVSRYIGGDTETVKLSRLGSPQWQKTKSRVAAAVRDMADELIALYAKRMSRKGFAFSADTDLQHDFEYHFAYEETADQLRCCEQIKADMEKSVPMERLLCGDVGFGKTEVALRAAFKCICDGKQVAILVPTTILAWQHYKTISERMEHYAVSCEMLSRFRTQSQQTKIKKQLKRGSVDIVVGTHRIISSDIQFKDLGLLIVDEEQRFGVAQKEKLKQQFPDVDVLTLSATPIPRTLNMAMTGIRDMSVIEEAPTDRHPVQTYVLEYDRSVLLDAVRKEVARGGQVYYIYNRVQSIERAAARLKADLPDVSVAVAHGQMSEEELADKWRMLIDGEIDVLVCTTIIETGIDVPNVNTLIIEDADRFGLAQLHQLRGRVGRSARRAYAYLMYRQGKALTEIASKRLEAIREYTEFGSGFKIAMRDLEIRGTGNILGAKQHGHMESVGYDMYLRLLSDAVKEQKGEQVIPQTECVVDISISAHIPEWYIESTPARLQIYREIAQIQSEQDSSDVIDELIDRFGEPPGEVMGLIDAALLRNRAARLGITEIKESENCITVLFSKLEWESVDAMIKIFGNRLRVGTGDKPMVTVYYNTGTASLEKLRSFINEYEKLHTPIPSPN